MEFYEDGDEVISIWKPQPQFQGWIDTLHDEFIEPTKQYADIIIPNGGNNQKAIEILKLYIEKILGR
jgi:uridine kinase